MIIEPHYREVEIESPLSPDDAENVIAATLRKRFKAYPGREVREGWSRFYIGSLAALNFDSLWSDDAWRWLPIRIDAQALPSVGGSQVKVQLESNGVSGRILSSRNGVLYEQAFDRVIEMLAVGLGGTTAAVAFR